LYGIKNSCNLGEYTGKACAGTGAGVYFWWWLEQAFAFYSPIGFPLESALILEYWFEPSRELSVSGLNLSTKFITPDLISYDITKIMPYCNQNRV
jgi:hypothetical protein